MDPAEIIKITGSPMLPGIVAPKLTWVREHEPRAHAIIAHVILPKDYIRYRLSGVIATDVTDASGTGIFDVGRRTWSERMLEVCGMPREWFPEVFESQEIAGFVNAEASEQTGLPVGTPIAAGAGDQPATGVGAGAVSQGVVSIALGTSAAVLSQHETYHPDPQGRVQTYCHAVPGKWQTMGVMLCAAGSVSWLSDVLGMVYSEMDTLAGSAEPGSEGLIFLPYLSGERAPHNDALARGSFIGFTLRHEAKHLIRAVLEGVAYSIKDAADALAELGVSFDNVTLSGGGARSALWSSIIASTLAKELHYLPVNEGAAYGAALLASVSAGFYPSIELASKSTLHRKGVVLPDPQLALCYKKAYPLYQACYPSLKAIFSTL
jgi:xylulokinase